MAELFTVLTVDAARRRLASHLGPRPAEEVELAACLGRSLAADVYAAEDLPGFDRSTMDGFAVRAADTFGASEGLPAYMELDGEVPMGAGAGGPLAPGRVRRISTGGMLPPGADAVVMVEYSEEVDGFLVGITRPVAPLENVIRRDEDAARGDRVLTRGMRLTPQDLGAAAALGRTGLKVFNRPRVGIVSTGDELVPVAAAPGPGQVRNINSVILAGLVEEDGGIPVFHGIVPDRLSEIEAALHEALAGCDLVLLSGGSSVGSRDWTARAIASLGQPGLLFHGLALRPGKPTIGAVALDKPVFGLPGHPVSALVVYLLLVRPLVRRGDYTVPPAFWPARITRSIPSAAGREDYVRVRLRAEGETLWAQPVLGKSGLINTMVPSHALARIPPAREGLEAGDPVEIYLLRGGPDS
ncbi:MAG: molybdopterin molybdotransferase MoeA [Peptococcaceae bacterium]|jgi:molybdopterin molybdotransferase|nr:molybdopterin molybdotransferase MoeA [Peptococcaceae bacterium]